MASPFTINADLALSKSSVAGASRQIQGSFSKLNVDTSNLKGYGYALGRITDNANEFGKSLDAASARVFAFGATTFVLNSVQDGFRKIISTTVEVEKALIDIKSVGDLTTESLIKLRKSIFEVAANTGQGFNSTAEAAGELARQGLSASENIRRLTTALQISRVAGIGSAEAVKFLTATLNGYSDANLSAAVVGSKLVAVDRAAAVSAKDLSDALSRSASVANSAGVNLDELLAITTAVEQRTARGGAVIGNAFKSIFARLSRGGIISQLQELGVAVSKSQTGIQKLQAIANSFQTINDSVGQNKVLELGAGVYNINVLSAAIDDLRDSNSQYNKSLQDSQNASGDLQRINEQLNTTLDTQFQRISVGFTKLAQNIGEVSLKPLIKDLNSKAEIFLDFFKKLDPDAGSNYVKSIFQSINNFITGPGLVLVGTAITKLTLKIFEFARTGFAQLTNISGLFGKLGGDVQQVGQKFSTLPKSISQSGPAIDTIISKEKALAAELININQLLERQAAIRNNTTRAATSKSIYGSGTSGKASELKSLKDLYVDPSQPKTSVRSRANSLFSRTGFSGTGAFGRTPFAPTPYPKPFLQRAYEDQTQSGNRSTSDLIRSKRAETGSVPTSVIKKNKDAFEYATRNLINQTVKDKIAKQALQKEILSLGQAYNLSRGEIISAQKSVVVGLSAASSSIKSFSQAFEKSKNKINAVTARVSSIANAPFARTGLGKSTDLGSIKNLLPSFSKSGFASGAAIAAPFIASLASGFAEESSKTAKALDFAGTLGAVGSLFGPVGAAFGTGVGALTSTIKNQIEESFSQNGTIAKFLEKTFNILPNEIDKNDVNASAKAANFAETRNAVQRDRSSAFFKSKVDVQLPFKTKELASKALAEFISKIKFNDDGTIDTLEKDLVAYAQAAVENTQFLEKERRASESIISSKNNYSKALLKASKEQGNLKLQNQLVSSPLLSNDQSGIKAISNLNETFSSSFLKITQDLESIQKKDVLFSRPNDSIADSYKVGLSQGGFVRSQSTGRELEGSVFKNLIKSIVDGGEVGGKLFLNEFTKVPEETATKILSGIVPEIDNLQSSFLGAVIEQKNIQKQILDINKKIVQSNIQVGSKLAQVFEKNVDLTSVADTFRQVRELQSTTNARGVTKTDNQQQKDNQLANQILASSAEKIALASETFGPEITNSLAKNVDFGSIKNNSFIQVFEKTLRDLVSFAGDTPGGRSAKLLGADALSNGIGSNNLDLANKFSKIVTELEKIRREDPAKDSQRLDLINVFKSFIDNLAPSPNTTGAGVIKPLSSSLNVFSEDTQLQEEKNNLVNNMSILNEGILKARDQLDFSGITSKVDLIIERFIEISENSGGLLESIAKVNLLSKNVNLTLEDMNRRLMTVGA
jgi:TP901 family phage tail tape measure protein